MRLPMPHPRPAAGASVTAAGFPARLLACALLLSPAGCAANPPADAAPPRPAAERTVLVLQHGWHTGVVFKAADLPPQSPLRREFPQAEHIEVGWGDRAYYPAEDPGLWLGLRALLWPTPGALHIAAFSGSPQALFPQAPMVALGVSRAGLARMHERVGGSFERGERGDVRPLGPGLYAHSRFYASREAFHAFKTCNVWTAQVLREGGIPVSPGAAILAGGLMRQLEPAARPQAAAGPSK